MQKVFDKFYDQYRKEGFNALTILFNLLPGFVDDVSDAWGYDVSLNPNRSNAEIMGSRPFMEAEDLSAQGKLKLFLITENGNVYRVGIKSNVTGGVTWNGDDEYYKNIAIDYVNPVLVGTVTTIKNMDENLTLTAERMENIAAEIISVTMQQ